MNRRTASGNPPEELLPATALSRNRLEALIADLGQKPYRATQIRTALLGGRARTWDEIAVLPRSLRLELSQRQALMGTRVHETRLAPDRTVKLCVGTPDGQLVECALIPSGKRLTLCLSTQAGCPIGCVFCASGIGGLARDLVAWEILEQALHARALFPERPISHLVVMGVGEPLLNLPQLLPALETLQDPLCLGLGARRILVSTSGIPSGMEELSRLRPPFGLAVSLHCADQELRARLVPTANRHPVRVIVDAAHRYQATTGRQVSFEVVMLSGINDAPSQACDLAALLGGKGFHVNLIPLNPVPGLPFETPPTARVLAFARVLHAKGVWVTLRRPRGRSEAAACGQLRCQGPCGAQRPS